MYTSRKGKIYDEEGVVSILKEQLALKKPESWLNKMLAEEFNMPEDVRARLIAIAKPNILSVIDSIRDIFGEEEVESEIELFQSFIPQTHLDALNDKITKVKHTWALSYRDLAIAFIAFRYNVEHHSDGACSGEHIIGMTRDKRVGEEFNRKHTVEFFKIFQNLKLAEKVEDYNSFKGKSRTWKML